MNIKALMDDINDEVELAGIKIWWDKFTLLGWLAAELTKLTGEMESDCFYVHLNPAVRTVSGTRYYPLPSNFGSNFAANAGDGGDQWCCMIDDGTNEKQLNYVPAATFFSKNLAGQSNAKPTEYTIISTQDGGRQIGLSPTPDDAYSIDGLYKPTNWDLENMESMPPIPNNSMVLKYAVLKRIDANRWAADYQQAMAALAMSIAKSSRGRIVPGYGGAYNTYSRLGR